MAIMRAVVDADAVVIPFGGGTNISGSLEAPGRRGRARSSPSTSARMDRVLEIDEDSRIARIQAGVVRPARSRRSSTRAGWTVGHFPDSFTHSTLGGWIATRSSGMQSDKYGDVADLTRAVRVVTPAGTLVTRPVPTTSTGPSVREMVLGSEGRLGIISEATVHVHRVPEKRVILGYLFPDWRRALAAMRAIAESDAAPSVTRVSDAPETRFSFATRKAPTAVDRLKSKGADDVPRPQGELRRPRPDVPGVHRLRGREGARRDAAQARRQDRRPPTAASASASSPGELYDQKKFDTPVHPRLPARPRRARRTCRRPPRRGRRCRSLYDNVMAAARGAFADLGVPRLHHVPPVALLPRGRVPVLHVRVRAGPDGGTAIDQYDRVKAAIQQAFIDSGATLSHHHAVGTEHARWLEEDISAPGVAMLRALFDGMDPGANLNPGKIVGPAARPVAADGDGGGRASQPADRPARARLRAARPGV